MRGFAMTPEVMSIKKDEYSFHYINFKLNVIHEHVFQSVRCLAYGKIDM